MDAYSYSINLNLLLTLLLEKISEAEDLEATLHDHIDYIYGDGIAVIFKHQSYLEIYQCEKPFDLEYLEKLQRKCDSGAFVTVSHMEDALYARYRKLLDTAANKKYRTDTINSLTTLLNKE
jgi:hypothetical protein